LKRVPLCAAVFTVPLLAGCSGARSGGSLEVSSDRSGTLEIGTTSDSVEASIRISGDRP